MEKKIEKVRSPHGKKNKYISETKKNVFLYDLFKVSRKIV